MKRKLRPFVHSLGVCLLVPLFLTVCVVLTIHAMISFRSTKENFLRFVEADIERHSELIKGATHDGMLLNRKYDVQSTIERLGNAPELSTIRVYNLKGTTMMSAEPDEIGHQIGLESETCQSCHCHGAAGDATVLERRSLVHSSSGQEVLRHLSAIKNTPSCSTADCHAHPADQEVLGILEVEMSMAPLERTLQTSRRQFLWTTLTLVVIVGLVTAVIIRRLVQRPVKELFEGTLRIAAGDLETHVKPRGHHELARLAVAFNQMASDLSAARLEITEWSQKLEDKVVQKTEELSRVQRHVLQMEKMSSLGKLSATVAHELNNPISGILTYAQLVRRELAEQPIQESVREDVTRYLRFMEKELIRCGAIVQNMLVFARRSGASMAPTDLNEVVDRALMLVRHHPASDRVTLHCEPLAGDSQIIADAGQLQQALLALLVNAMEAMSECRERGELSVVLRGDADEVHLTVSDTGVGIPSEVLPQIFEPFFSTKDEASGVGLGLAVVYGIIQRHGGRIEVETEFGQGTIFHLWLPRHPAPKDSQAAVETGQRLPLG